MGRSRDSFARSKAHFKAQPTVLILCEDLKSSRNYLQEASQYFRAHALVEIAHTGNTDPLNIVKVAHQRAKHFDRVICVIDRDTHATFDAAVELAKNTGTIELIVSYPCFEYWLLLHFSQSRKQYAPAGNKSGADLLINDLCEFELVKLYKKGNIKGLFDRLLGVPFAHARTHSPRVLKDAHDCGQMNPSTRLHELISILEALGKATPT